jgi:pyrroline-5-carboxylate reductase
MSNFPNRILMIGCGNMAGAILAGWLRAGLDPRAVSIFDPFAKNLPEGTHHFTKVPEDFAAPDFVMIGVKPNMLRDVAADWAHVDFSNAMVVSILAGVELAELRSALPDAGTIVRLMPNMAVSIGKAVQALIGEPMAKDAKAKLTEMMKPLGLVEWLSDEMTMHVFVALAGSGPAFVFRIIDALAKGAADLGMDKAQAARFALAMVEGSALLAAQSDDTPGALADKVASPGGTTRAGLNVLDQDDAALKLMRKTLDAATKRSQEISEEAKG